MSEIVIVSAVDEGYVAHFCAMLHSAWLYHQDARYFLIDAGTSEVSLAKLRAFAAERAIRLDILPAEERIFSELPDYPRRSAFGRVFAAELLPSDVERVIYLDADMTVIGPLNDLFCAEIDGAIVGVCRDAMPKTIERETPKQSINFDGKYFNSGMLLIDLKRWRSGSTTKEVLSFAREKPSHLLYMDQSALNVVLLGKVKHLPNIWNFFNVEFGQTDPKDVRIIHHTNYRRPWMGYTPFSDIYHFHRAKTPFAMEIPAEQFIERFHSARRVVMSKFWPSKYRRAVRRAELYKVAHELITKPALIDACRRTANLNCVNLARKSDSSSIGA